MVRSYNQIKQRRKGFTIVELLIVIVVIAILATITIISYNGITAKAHNVKVATNVETVQKVAEGCNADNSAYPATVANFTAGCGTTPTSKLPAGVTVILSTAAAGSALAAVTTAATTYFSTAANIPNVYFAYSGTAAVPTGGVLIFWDYSTKAVTLPANYVYYGAATSASTFNN